MVQNFSINLTLVYLNQTSEPVQGTKTKTGNIFSYFRNNKCRGRDQIFHFFYFLSSERKYD